MSGTQKYDVAIAGGGLAGLACAIMLARQQLNVVFFEKETYPFHKVCGEYISLESYDFLSALGVNLSGKDIPMISRLQLSSASGNVLSQRLPLGGFGISRFRMDDELASIARKEGAHVLDGTKVTDILFGNDNFELAAGEARYSARCVLAAFGKRSNLDIKWNRSFTQKKAGALNNFVAVKYHATLDHPRDLIALHNFSGGYCGISPVEDGRSCICYLTTAQNLRNASNDIRKMEENTLFRNHFIREAFADATLLYHKPLTISQISFSKKEQVEDHILMVGDAAGMIAPLCGNGMSMALHAARIAVPLVSRFLKNGLSREAMEQSYQQQWNAAFARRLSTGRMIQTLFGNERMTNFSVRFLSHFPGLVDRIIRRTHG
jgi:flavin-dependent dehydrogenase